MPQGDVTIEHIQHSFYMAANYGFQILNGNFAAAIDDYELKLRFMNDLATYRINVSWLWALAHHQAAITKDGHLQRQALTEDGVVFGANAEPVKAGTRFTRDALPEGVELPRRVDDRLLRRARPAGRSGPLRPREGPRHHGAPAPAAPLAALHPAQRPRALRGRAGERRRSAAQILEAIFDLDRPEIAKRVQAGTMSQAALAAHDYVNDVFPESASGRGAA